MHENAAVGLFLKHLSFQTLLCLLVAYGTQVESSKEWWPLDSNASGQVASEATCGREGNTYVLNGAIAQARRNQTSM